MGKYFFGKSMSIFDMWAFGALMAALGAGSITVLQMFGIGLCVALLSSVFTYHFGGKL
jgi:hypothetical protein